MICLADNDIVLKLAACNILEAALDALSVAESDVFVLPSAPFFIRGKATSLRKRYGDGVDRALDFLARVKPVPFAVDFDEQATLTEAGDDFLVIDDGEAVLFASIGLPDDYLIATGDKRSLEALVTFPACDAIALRHQGRILCLEQVVERVLDHIGFVEARARIVPGMGCDTALRVVFGSGEKAQEPTVRESLASYIAGLRSKTGGLLIP